MVVEPTAPRAWEPANRPTTAMSDILKRACNRLERTSGTLKMKICRASGPSVRFFASEDIAHDSPFSGSFWFPWGGAPRRCGPRPSQYNAAPRHRQVPRPKSCPRGLNMVS